MIATLLSFAALGFVPGMLAWVTRRLTARVGDAVWRRAGLVVSIVLAFAGLPFIAVAAYLVGSLVLGQPGPEDRRLGDGVRYRREVLNEPRRVVVHVLEVDLTRGHRIVASRPDHGAWNEAITATRA